MTVVPLHRDRAATIGGSDAAYGEVPLPKYQVTCFLNSPVVDVVADDAEDARSKAVDELEVLIDNGWIDPATWEVSEVSA